MISVTAVFLPISYADFVIGPNACFPDWSDMEVTMSDSHFCSIHASSMTARDGNVHAPDLSPGEIRFSAPAEFGGTPGQWTPEHFLLSAVASCFVATFQAVAKASAFEFARLDVVAEGIVQKIDGRLKFSSVTVNPTLTIGAEEDRDLAAKLLNKTEHSCIVANSLSTPVAFAPQIAMSKMSRVGS